MFLVSDISSSYSLTSTSMQFNCNNVQYQRQCSTQMHIMTMNVNMWKNVMYAYSNVYEQHAPVIIIRSKYVLCLMLQYFHKCVKNQRPINPLRNTVLHLWQHAAWPTELLPKVYYLKVCNYTVLLSPHVWNCF